MTGQILVPLKSRESIGEVIPYLEDIAAPGLKVVFLVHYLARGLDWLPVESKTGGIATGWPALNGLREKGVTIGTELYAGSLNNVVKVYARQGDVQLVMISVGSRSRIVRLLRKFLLFFHVFGLTQSSPVLLLHPDRR